jgi:signal transduction histidine kinase
MTTSASPLESRASGVVVGVHQEKNVPPALRFRHRRVALRLLFDNLIDNAIKYSDRGRKIVLCVRSETKSGLQN